MQKRRIFLPDLPKKSTAEFGKWVKIFGDNKIKTKTKTKKEHLSCRRAWRSFGWHNQSRLLQLFSPQQRQQRLRSCGGGASHCFVVQENIEGWAGTQTLRQKKPYTRSRINLWPLEPMISPREHSWSQNEWKWSEQEGEKEKKKKEGREAYNMSNEVMMGEVWRLSIWIIHLELESLISLKVILDFKLLHKARIAVIPKKTHKKSLSLQFQLDMLPIPPKGNWQEKNTDLMVSVRPISSKTLPRSS